MHRWERTPEGARCTFCDIRLTGIDAEDVFRGPPTPLSDHYIMRDASGIVVHDIDLRRHRRRRK